MLRNYYPCQTLWDVQARIAWMEASGPRYTDMQFTFVRCVGDKAMLIFEGDQEPVGYGRTKMSYASWLMCLSANSGDRLELKIRCDDLSFET